MAYYRQNILNSRAKGNIGENSACKYLEKSGYIIVERNYQKKWGELDIIATKDGILHFIEVKSIKSLIPIGQESHRPEENVDGLKVSHIRKMIQTYLNEKTEGDQPFQFHVLCVYFKSFDENPTFKMIENIIV